MPRLRAGISGACNDKKYKKYLFIQFSFEGEKIRYKKSQYKGKDDNYAPVEAEGRLFYSENIIVCLPQKVNMYKLNGTPKGWENSTLPNQIWYYTIINGELCFDKKIHSMFVHNPWFYPGALKKN
jgi:hypothetical protein